MGWDIKHEELVEYIYFLILDHKTNNLRLTSFCSLYVSVCLCAKVNRKLA